ncbi:MAG: pyruvate kinase [Planctomycetaceae bacterium]|nr:pyruvate kinase [Planctomycetaceae bacterium]
MDLRQQRHSEHPLVRTKIVATVGPACEPEGRLEALVRAGVDVFRLNFAHGSHEWLAGMVRRIREAASQAGRPIGLLGDLAGPKIRLGELPGDELECREGDRFEFIRGNGPSTTTELTSTWDRLIDDLSVGDAILLADGAVGMRVEDKPDSGDRLICRVEQAGRIRSRQGINLPGVKLSIETLTEKDRDDLAWALKNGLDFIGLSFVRSADDIRLLKGLIAEADCDSPPQVIAKIEKLEAIEDLQEILNETDAVMVARGDLGVEADIARVPVLQKRIIRLCSQFRVPVITATQMLDSMQTSERPTRAEASDVANAVLDGSDAVMLSGETAIGNWPVETVSMMSRIVVEAEQLLERREDDDFFARPESRALMVTEAVILGAGTAAEDLEADLIVVGTHSGRTALAVSRQRNPVPVLALTDNPAAARRMCLYWGVTPLETSAVLASPQELLQSVIDWGRKHQVLESGSRLVLVASTDWSAEGHDLMLVHVVE